jgi:hypothetical protein
MKIHKAIKLGLAVHGPRAVYKAARFSDLQFDETYLRTYSIQGTVELSTAIHVQKCALK